MKIKTALISVSDKTGLLALAQELKRNRVTIYSTGGTLAFLKQGRIPVRSITELTQTPELLGGRVKTLHPKVHGGLLFLRGDLKQVREAKQHGICPIDLVVVNLYPFRETVRKPRVTLKQAAEQIDIGGPTMLRSGAKNFKSVTVVCDPGDYPQVIQELKTRKGAVSPELNRVLAQKVFRHTSAYDGEIARYLSSDEEHSSEGLPKTLHVTYEQSQILRYGENPHQRAALYRRQGEIPKFSFEQIHGKELSYNNILDFEAAVDTLREFKEPAACVVKHNNPCGIAAQSDLTEAVVQAIDSDSMSAFGGIVGVNRVCSEKIAKTITEKLHFFEVMVAPDFSPEALRILKSRKNLRILRLPNLYDIGPYDLRFTKSGVLLQDRNQPIWKREAKLAKNLRWVTRKKLEAGETDDLIFAWKCVKVVRSNAIVLTQGKRTVGIGAGQMSRVDSVKIACMKAGERSYGSILASDAFFPMPDNIEVAHAHGIRAIVQPGGSIRDQDVIDACNQFGIAMAFTGERHFRH
ncbi:MAG: bifunctional phosphoribosylaminoimidazolecarboxamide formyltransferase/IMP cyclohydrolase [Omnitrophica bacterium RIFCSPLOWO2_01_FULL_50_24]|nr:MAG: bifunctional phosphoribosylaminoimidazolecarboxamide formyltransferase/IMP cyclohydrolase [Omnitrophica bacterium RIFCSPLOWO2_01_FULL_50_24]